MKAKDNNLIPTWGPNPVYTNSSVSNRYLCVYQPIHAPYTNAAKHDQFHKQAHKTKRSVEHITVLVTLAPSGCAHGCEYGYSHRAQEYQGQQNF